MNSLERAVASSFFTRIILIYLSLALISEHGRFLANAQGVSDNEFCNLPAAPGFCYAYFPMFYYDSKTGQCKEFVYGGCGGNRNRFESIKQCEKAKRACLRRRN